MLILSTKGKKEVIHEGREGRSAANRNRTVSFFAPKGLRIIAQGCGVSRYPGSANAMRSTPTGLRPEMPIHQGNDATPSGLFRASGKPRVAANAATLGYDM